MSKDESWIRRGLTELKRKYPSMRRRIDVLAVVMQNPNASVEEQLRSIESAVQKELDYSKPKRRPARRGLRNGRRFTR